MTAMSEGAAQAAIGAAARELKLPAVRDQATRLAEIAARDHAIYLAYLAEVLAAELDDRTARRRARRIADARFPRLKRLADHGCDRPAGCWSGPGREWLAALELPAVSREVINDALADTRITHRPPAPQWSQSCVHSRGLSATVTISDK
jgi:hypothetical protein